LDLTLRDALLAGTSHGAIIAAGPIGPALMTFGVGAIARYAWEQSRRTQPAEDAR
jgi:hypothetical protein